MTDTRIPQGEMWVCDTCMFAHANGVDMRHESDGGNPDDPAPWARGFKPGEVTMGMFADKHDCPKATDDEDRECDCEVQEYSYSSCDGCGSPLHGRRHAFTYWS